MSHSREADTDERNRLNGLMYELNDYLDGRRIPLQDKVNVCLNVATELLIIASVDLVQTRVAWLQHCAVIFDETIAGLSKAKA